MFQLIDLDIEYIDLKTQDLQNTAGLYKELLTTEDFAGSMLSASNQMQITDIMVNLSKIAGEDPKIINKMISAARKRLNENTMSTVYHIQKRTEEFGPLQAEKEFTDLVNVQDLKISKRADEIYKELKYAKEK